MLPEPKFSTVRERTVSKTENYGWRIAQGMLCVAAITRELLKSAAALAVNCNAAKGRWCSEYSDWFNAMHEK